MLTKILPTFIGVLKLQFGSKDQPNQPDIGMKNMNDKMWHSVSLAFLNDNVVEVKVDNVTYMEYDIMVLRIIDLLPLFVSSSL